MIKERGIFDFFWIIESIESQYALEDVCKLQN